MEKKIIFDIAELREQVLEPYNLTIREFSEIVDYIRSKVKFVAK